MSWDKGERGDLDSVLDGAAGGLLGILLFHDFMAGLGEERLWGQPVAGDESPAVRPGSTVVIAPVEALTG